MTAISRLTPQATPTLELELDARPENVVVARQAAMAAAEQAGLDDSRVEDVALAVGEACGNVVNHAYAGEPQPGPLIVRLAVGEGRLDVEVTDRGSGIAPRTDSPGMGMGIPLITALADATQLSAAEEQGSVVWMLFERHEHSDTVASTQ